MHQYPRPAPRSFPSSNNASADPSRTNSPRGEMPQRTRSSVDLASYTERAGEQPRAQDRETTKLNQIIQHFHSKAALMICSSRVALPQAYIKSGEVKQNRWFNTVLDETDVLQDALQEWKRPDLSENRPPPLVIEVYVDTSHLRENQALVMVDDTGKRWDVSDALAGSADSSPRPQNKSGRKHYEVMLERWTIELGDPAGYTAAELNDQLPNVYKKGVVLFRSLYTFLRFLPAWKLHRRLGRQPGKHQALRLKFRIREGTQRSSPQGQKDALSTPLCPSDSNNTATVSSKTTERHALQPLACPAGLLRVRIDYRSNQDLDTVDVEALLSSRLDTATPPHHENIMDRHLSDADGNMIDQPRRKSSVQGKTAFKHGSLGDSPPSKLKALPRPSSLTQGFQQQQQQQQQQQMGTLIEEGRRQMPPPRHPVAASAPATERFTSSFAGRTKRPTSITSHTTNRSNDSGGSSARGSASEHTTKSDDENIQDFISLIGQAAETQATRPPRQRYELGLDRFRNLGEPARLADDMASSSLLSSTPQSRRLSNVPGLSTSSSPRAHAPHVRSRLSTNSIAEEGARLAGSSGARPDLEEAEEEDEPFLFAQEM